jgi:hypothetical protein
MDNGTRIDGYDTFDTWAKKFEGSHQGKSALETLKKLYDNSPISLQSRFKEEVLRACYYAFLFWCIGDVNSEKRDLLRDIANQDDPLYDTIGSAISEISFFHSIHDTLIREGAREFIGDDALNIEIPISIDNLLRHLELYQLGIHRFQDNEDTHTTREECWIYGNMRYPKRIDKKNQHNKKDASTCLMLQLAIFFRLWTHPKGQKLFDKKLKLCIPKRGIPLVKEGKRNDKVIAAFVNATFSNQKLLNKKNLPELQNVSEQSVRSRLEKISPEIHLIPWTEESFDLSIKVPAKTVQKIKTTQKIVQ